jgi:hypothetical protein
MKCPYMSKNTAEDSGGFCRYRNGNGDPEVAVRVDGVGAVTEKASAVELRGNPGHGDQRERRGDDVDLQIAQPRQIVQMGIAEKVDRPGQ